MTKKKSIQKQKAVPQKPAAKSKAENASSFSLLRLLWLGLLIIVFIPLIKTLSSKDDLKKKNPPAFSGATWFDGDYQKKTESFLKKNWVFGPSFIALKNQIDFDWFNK